MCRLILARRGSLLAAARRRFPALLLLAAFALAPTIAAAQPAAQASTVSCNGILPFQAVRKGGGSGASQQQPNLVISSACTVNRAGNYFYGNVNIIKGGSLTFSEPPGTGTLVEFWASNIIVENGGALVAGASGTPYGSRGGVLNIYLYGKNQSGTSDPYANPGQGALCVTQQSSTVGPCGIPASIWNDNGTTFQTSLPGGVSDYFYQYGPDYGDNLCSDGKTQWNPTTGCGNPSLQVGYFGYKVLAVSYGGTLKLFGYKGTPLRKAPPPRFVDFFGNQGGGGKSPFTPFFGQQATTSQAQGAAGNSSGSSNAGAAAVNPKLIDADPTSTGYAWMRLAANLPVTQAGAGQLTLSKATGDRWWSANDNKSTPDQVVVTTTDYLPGHSEELVISNLQGTTLSFKNPIKYFHNGTRYPIASRLGTSIAQRYSNSGMDSNLINNGAETRAAVALLTRSIRILSAGDTPGQTWEQASKVSTNCQNGAVVPNCYYFGGHTIFRQGFQQIQVQGVEFKNLGQGGKLGHYPVHFHMARQVPAGTFVKDSVINESMTRWITLHSTQGVLLQRNVGWKSIGHGFFLENGTETDNKLYSNLGIFARAAIANPQNPRMVPGIFSAGPTFAGGGAFPGNPFPFASDIQQPTVFWISNGENEFVGNMAAGAGACGAAYWFVPAQNSDMADVPSSTNQWFGTEMKWPSLSNTSSTASTTTTSYAGLQNSIANTGITPLRRFYGNYATSAMNSFQTVAQLTPCFGIDYPGATQNFPGHDILGIKGFAPAPTTPTNGVSNQPANGTAYYPYVGGGSRIATLCPVTQTGLDCSSISGTPPSGGGSSTCSNPPNETSCAVTVLDHFTSSFHWAEQNFAAIWLRPNWLLVVNSVLTDVQTAGITFVSGGDYTRSSSIQGGWKLIRDSIFAGYTQSTSNGYPANPYVSNASPFMNGPGSLTCDNASGAIPPALSCINAAEGVSFPLSNFGTGQRLFNIYDGPAYQDSNIYLDIQTAACGNGEAPPNGTYCLYSLTPGVRLGNASSCYLPNAAIGWKQPNGFFYPPTFHSTNLFFGNVDIRHYVIDALFNYGSYNEDTTAAAQDYCSLNGGGVSSTMFNSFTDIDRQTELSDDDGSLTGLINNWDPPNNTTGTVSVNPTSFFTAPVQTDQCLSNVGVTPSLACQSTPPPTPTTAITSPYEYVTMAVYPACGVGSNPTCTNWAQGCDNPSCYGVPLYRQYLAGSDAGSSSTGEWMYWNTTDSCSAGTTSTNCRWPFVRMGGESPPTYQRSTLTANNGSYFLDTSVGAQQQTSEPFTSPVPATASNVFQAGQTYYVYFLFAKPDTQQTIQVYVGPGFLPSNVSGVQLVPNSWPLQTSDITVMSPGTLPTGWTQNYNAGILTVTTNFSALSDIVPSPANGLCMPSSFCTASGTSCGCTLASTDPLYNQCQQACSKWAVKDLDFPPSGAYGFAFTLPAGFTTTTYNANALGSSVRPAPTPFPTAQTNTNGPDWTSLFLNTTVSPDNASGGQCYYPNLPSNSSSTCPVIYPNPTSN